MGRTSPAASASAFILVTSRGTYLLLYLSGRPGASIHARNAPPAVVESIRRQLGLDLPLWQQYLRYLGNLLQGDLGRSYIQKTEVATLILSRLPATPAHGRRHLVELSIG